jgi:hypothetical protein
VRADELNLPRSAGTGSRRARRALRRRLPAARGLHAAMEMTTSATNDLPPETKFDATIFSLHEASVASLMLTTEAVNVGVHGGPSRQAAA